MALTKILNDENKSFKPVLTDKLVYDTKPTVNSFNGITSDAVARAIAGASGEVPAVTESDNGKVLKAIYDEGGAAVEWADAPSGIPDMAGQDGKILGAVDNSGTMEAQWISKPVSNVTTSDKQFVVGVNGTGLPITVDCANATTVGTTSTFTENGSYTTFQDKPSVKFPLAHLDPCSLGSGTATLTIPEDITYDTMNMALSSVTIYYWSETRGPGSTCTISESFLASGKIKAGTYTISGANSFPSYFSDGILFYVYGSGNPTAWNAFLTAFTEAVQSWTLSYTASEVTGYSLTPAVLPTVTGNAGKILAVNSGATGVEWVAQSTVTVDQSYNSASANAQSGTAVAGALATINQVPASTSADEDKVLTVNSSGNAVWAAAQGGGGGGSSASFNTTFDLIANGTNVWPAYVQHSSSPAPTIDLPDGVYAYRVEGYFIASAAVDDVYNIEVRVGNDHRDKKAIGFHSDSDNIVSINTSGILNIQSGYGISKAEIYVVVDPAKSSTSSVASTHASLKLKLAKL